MSLSLGRIALLLTVLAAGTAYARNEPLNEAKVFYDAFEFKKCLGRLERASAVDSTRAELAEIELYTGLCDYNLGLFDDAREHFKLALQFDREVRLPKLTSPKIRAEFAAVAQKLPPPEASPHPIAPPRLVSPEGQAQPNNAAAMTIAQPPRRFPTAPVVVAGAAVLAGGAAVYFGLQAKRYSSLAGSSNFESDAYRYGAKAQGDALAANISIGAAASLAATSALVYWLSRPK